MSQQIAVPSSNQSLNLINSEDALKGVLLYKKKRGFYPFIICIMIEDSPQFSVC